MIVDGSISRDESVSVFIVSCLVTDFKREICSSGCMYSRCGGRPEISGRGGMCFVWALGGCALCVWSLFVVSDLACDVSVDFEDAE